MHELDFYTQIHNKLAVARMRIVNLANGSTEYTSREIMDYIGLIDCISADYVKEYPKHSTLVDKEWDKFKQWNEDNGYSF